MGCFLACFGSTKDPKRLKHRNKVIPRENQRNGSNRAVSQDVSVSEDNTVADPISLVVEPQNKPEEQSSFGLRKRVTFNSSVKTYEPIAATEVAEDLEDGSESGGKRKEENLQKLNTSNSQLGGSLATCSFGSYPPNHRYRNCRDSDDEVEELDYEESDLDEEDYADDLENEVYDNEIDEDSFCSKVSRMVQEKEVETIGSNRNARDRSCYVHSVLNPVENLTQWKAVKARGTPARKQQKENSMLEQSSISKYSKHQNEEIAVDASLSNWLVSSESTPTSKSKAIACQNALSEKSMRQGSPVNLEDRPILGALTVEELKQLTISSSPRKSPSRSPDEMPIIGSVGSYWSHTDSDKDSGSVSSYKGIPNTTSKYREDKRVNWHSTPFETRLERALNRGTAEG